MVEEPDIWRAANLLLRDHGESAHLVAAQRADELLAAGDLEGQAVWKRIVIAVDELIRREPKDGGRLN